MGAALLEGRRAALSASGSGKDATQGRGGTNGRRTVIGGGGRQRGSGMARPVRPRPCWDRCTAHLGGDGPSLVVPDVGLPGQSDADLRVQPRPGFRAPHRKDQRLVRDQHRERRAGACERSGTPVCSTVRSPSNLRRSPLSARPRSTATPWPGRSVEPSAAGSPSCRAAQRRDLAPPGERQNKAPATWPKPAVHRGQYASVIRAQGGHDQPAPATSVPGPADGPWIDAWLMWLPPVYASAARTVCVHAPATVRMRASGMIARSADVAMTVPGDRGPANSCGR